MSGKTDKDGQRWDTGTHEDFYAYYERQSCGEAARLRFGAIQATVLRLIGQPQRALSVADIGCGAGTQSRLWAEQGHHVYGADINEALIGLARTRAHEAGLAIRFDVASATALPWADQSMDVCIAPELLEHVADWQAVLSELVRVLKPGGALYLSTSNRLCPLQEEFTLPLYAWYPGVLKRYVERLARTTHPRLAGYATYPAVNWFTFRGLRKHLAGHGVRCIDRFDMIDLRGRGRGVRMLVGLIRALAPLRFFGHMATPYTVLLGFKNPAASFGASATGTQAGCDPTV